MLAPGNRACLSRVTRVSFAYHARWAINTNAFFKLLNSPFTCAWQKKANLLCDRNLIVFPSRPPASRDTSLTEMLRDFPTDVY